MTVNSLLPNDDHEVLRQRLRAVLDKLTLEEQAILSFRFGLQEAGDHGPVKTMQEFDITRERLRQIEAKALRRAALSD